MKGKKSSPCDNKNKCKVEGALNTLCDIPNQKIKGLNLSFREIARRGDILVCKYLFDNLNPVDKAIVIANAANNPNIFCLCSCHNTLESIKIIVNKSSCFYFCKPMLQYA